MLNSRSNLKRKGGALTLSALLFLSGISPALRAVSSPLPNLRDYETQIIQLTQFWNEVDFFMDRSDVIPRQLAARLQDRAEIFSWVRDNTRPLPYKGILRGAGGVLQDRQGNSLDRALLLAELLTHAGEEVRLARGTLPRGEAWDQLTELSETPFDPFVYLSHERFLAAAAAAGEELGLQSSSPEAAAALFQESEKELSRWQALETELNHQLSAWMDAPPAASTESRSDWSDHWWVQVKEGASWIDLDPSLPGNEAGTGLTEAQAWFGPSEIPSDLHHQMIFRVVAHITTGDRTTRETLVEAAVVPSQLKEAVVNFGFMPLQGGDLFDWLLESKNAEAPLQALLEQYLEVEEWLPYLSVDGEILTDKSILTNGTIRENPDEPAVARVAAEAVGALGRIGIGSRRGPAAEESSWSGLSLEIETRSPGTEPTTLSYLYFDDTHASWKKAYDPEGVISDPAKYRLAGIAAESSFFLQGFLPSPLWVMDQVSQRLLAMEPFVLQSVLNPQFAPQPEWIMDLPSLPSEVLLFLNARLRDEALRQNHAVTGLSVFALHKNPAPLGTGEFTFRTALDLMENRLWARSPAPAAALALGVHDSVREWVALGQALSVEDMDPFYAQLQSAVPVEGNDWQILKSPADWTTLSPDAAPLGLTKAWERGDWALVNLAPGASTPINELWWHLNPQTGDVLIRDLRGSGSALSYSQISTSLLALAAAPAIEWSIVQANAIKFSMAMGAVGFADCFARNLNFGCCGFMAIALFAMGAGIGKLMVIGGVAGTAGGISAGITFDLMTSPLNPTLDLCPNLRNSGK